MKFIFVLALVVLSPELCFAQSPKKIPLPPDVYEIPARHLQKISGVAALADGRFAVVGDGIPSHGHIYPGYKRWTLPSQAIEPESVDVGYGVNDEELWLVLSQKNRMILDLQGGAYQLPKRYSVACGRGLKGVAVRYVPSYWEVAVLWYGGWPNGEDDECKKFSFLKPKVAILHWISGKGAIEIKKELELNVETPETNHRFKAPDLVWSKNGILVLLGSTKRNGVENKYTWLQEFDLMGNIFKGTPTLKLEEQWGDYRDGGGVRKYGKNWEALDWTLDEKNLVMGFDTWENPMPLVVFPYPYP